MTGLFSSGKSKDQIIEQARKLQGIVSDYWSKPTVDDVEQWSEQLDPDLRLSILAELTNILAKSYISSDKLSEFLTGLISTPKLVGKDPPSFWKKANIFNAQQGGQSQHELLGIFDALLRSQLGFGLEACGSPDGPMIYIDDLLLSGNRLVNDLRPWIPAECPKSCELHAIYMGVHSGGSYYAEKAVSQLAAKEGKKIELRVWRSLTFENASNSGSFADVYRLRKLPEDEATSRYIQEHVQGEPAMLRPEKESNKSKFFSSEQSRDLLENTFWSAGLHIREIAPDLKETHRPLGYTSTNSANKLGFGSIVITYRNCPNNCPLAYWVGDPWFPLFPRKVN